MDKYFIYNNLFTRLQFASHEAGRLIKRSTLTSVVYPAFDRGEYALSIILDLTMTSNFVDRRIFFIKLYFYGTIFSENSWIESYLTVRMQRCAINGVKPTFELVERGAPH